jgi:hypothetical protein
LPGPAVVTGIARRRVVAGLPAGFVSPLYIHTADRYGVVANAVDAQAKDVALAPEQKMGVSVASPAERADLIAYLKQISAK